MTLAQRIRDQRYAKGWGPDELASRAAISRTALYQIESGKTEQPRAGTLRRIAQALDIPTEALLGQSLGIVGLNSWHHSEVQPSFNAIQKSATHDEHNAVLFRLDQAETAEPAIDRKFRELLASPFGEGVARIVEETYRILPKPSMEPRW